MRIIFVLVLIIGTTVDSRAQLTVDNIDAFRMDEYLEITHTVLDSLGISDFLEGKGKYSNIKVDPLWSVYVGKGMSFSEGDILLYDPYRERKAKWLVNRGWDTTNIMLWKDCYGSYVLRPKWPDESEEDYQEARTPPSKCEPTTDGVGIIFSEPRVKADEEGTNYSFTIVCYTNFSYRKYYFKAIYSRGEISFVEKKSGGFHAY